MKVGMLYDKKEDKYKDTDVFFNVIKTPLEINNELGYIFFDMDETIQKIKMIRYYDALPGFFTIKTPISFIVTFIKKLKNSKEYIEGNNCI